MIESAVAGQARIEAETEVDKLREQIKLMRSQKLEEDRRVSVCGYGRECCRGAFA